MQGAPLPVRSKNAVLVLLCVAQFMLVLDVSVTNVALASIQRSLDFAPADLQWVITGYVLPFGGFLILGGRAGDLWGRRRLFVLGLGVFTAASLLCGLASSPGQLIGFRALQGLGGAMLSPAALSLLTSTFREGPERARALGIWGAIAAGGAAAGMLIGGVATDLANWRWVFFINIPVGVVAIAAAYAVLSESAGQADHHLDLIGSVTVTAGLMGVVFGLSQIVPRGATSAVVLVSIAAGLLLLGSFVIVEGRASQPLLPFELFKHPGVAGGSIVGMLSNGAVFGQAFFLALYLREVLGYSPTRTGLALFPLTIVVAVAATIAPRLLASAGLRVLLVLGTLLMTAGLALYTRLPVNGTYKDVLPATLVTALGLGFGLIGATLAATTGVRPEQQGVTSGVFNTAQQIGGAVGLAVLATLAATRTSHLALTQTADAALTGGFRLGFAAAAAFSALAGAAAVLLVPAKAVTDDAAVVLSVATATADPTTEKVD